MDTDDCCLEFDKPQALHRPPKTQFQDCNEPKIATEKKCKVQHRLKKTDGIRRREFFI